MRIYSFFFRYRVNVIFGVSVCVVSKPDCRSIVSPIIAPTWSQMGLDELSPMSNSIGPGMTTPTPGMHGYPGAMAYSRAVPDRGGVAAQQPGTGELLS